MPKLSKALAALGLLVLCPTARAGADLPSGFTLRRCSGDLCIRITSGAGYLSLGGTMLSAGAATIEFTGRSVQREIPCSSLRVDLALDHYLCAGEDLRSYSIDSALKVKVY